MALKVCDGMITFYVGWWSTLSFRALVVIPYTCSDKRHFDSTPNL
jgi:hypothetical protein